MKLFLLFFAGAALCPWASAQRATLVLREGDLVPGVGALTDLAGVAGVDEEGRWLAWVDTDNADNAQDGVLLSGTGIELREGSSLAQPAGATLDAIDGWSVTGSGGFFTTVSMDGTAGSAVDEALMRNGSSLLREGDPVGASAFSSGTNWRQLFEVWSVSPDFALLAGNVDDPNLPSTTDRALVLLNLDVAGQIASSSVVGAEGSLFGTGLPALADVGVSPQSAALNTAGSVLFQGRFDGAPASSDVALFLDGQLLAREGDPSPMGTRSWEILAERPVDLNDSGSWVVRANLDGEVADDEVILLQSAAGPRVIAREGDALPPFGGDLLESFGLNSPVFVSADDSVLWFADWSDDDTSRDSGLIYTQLDHPNPDFVHQLLIREGVTRFEGLLVDSIASAPGGYAMSRDGRYVLCEVRFVGGIEGLVLLDRTGPHPSFCAGDVGTASGCEPCPCGNEVPIGVATGCRHSSGVGAELVTVGDAEISADSLRFEVRSGIPSSFALLLSGSGRLPNQPGHPCFGLDTGVGQGNLDGLSCVGGALRFHGVRRSDLSGDVGVTNAGFGPPDRPFSGLGVQGGSVAGETRHFQVWMREFANATCQTGLATTNGRTVVWLP